MKNTKICFVTREYAYENMGKTGGIGVFVRQHTQCLKLHDFDIVVFSFGAKAIRFNDNGVSVVKIKDLSGFNERIKEPIRRHKIRGYITLKIILEYINRLYISIYLSIYSFRKCFDIIEFHDYGGDTPFFIGRVPKVVRCHGSAMVLHEYMNYSKRITDTIFERLLFKRFNKNVIAVSNTSAKMTQNAFKLKKKPTIIYNGVKVLEESKLLQQNYLNAPTIKDSIFYFGSVRERKGIDLACEIFNELIEIIPTATFHIMGSNNNKHWDNVCINILSENALKSTTYYGEIKNKNVISYLKKAHMAIFPSYGENFSIALLEAMSIGKIVVTSKIPAFEEIIKHNYNGFIASNKESYVNFILKIFNNDVPIELICINAKKTIKNNFNLNLIIEENVNYYKSLL